MWSGVMVDSDLRCLCVVEERVGCCRPPARDIPDGGKAAYAEGGQVVLVEGDGKQWVGIRDVA